MKVEFLESDMYGAELCVSATEFLKAKKDNVEFDSLVHATEAFSALLGLDYCISRNEYDAVVNRLDNTGVVIFTVCEDKYPSRRWCEVFVSKNNQPERIAYEDEDGRHLKLYAKYDPKAAARIKKRHEEEVKQHE